MTATDGRGFAAGRIAAKTSSVRAPNPVLRVPDRRLAPH